MMGNMIMFAAGSIVLLGAVSTGLEAQKALIRMEQNKPDHDRVDLVQRRDIEERSR